MHPKGTGQSSRYPPSGSSAPRESHFASGTGVPQLNVRGPSFEAPQPPAHVPDPGRLKPDYSKAQEVQERRQRANQDSGIVDWLLAHGIPVFDARIKKSANEDAKTSLTASNVDQTHLVDNLAWGFFEVLDTEEVEPAEYAYAHRHIFDTVWEYKSRAYAQTLPLKIPEDWTKARGIDTTSVMLQSLGMHFKAMSVETETSGEKPRFELCSRKDVESLKYPEAKVTLNEVRKFKEDPALCIEWSMFKILGFPGVSKCRSEMDVERHVGSILAGFFNVHGCVTSSGNQIKYPTAIGCFGSFPKPDFGTRISWSKSVPELFRPLVIVGEAKRDASLKDRPMDEKEAPRNRISAQLAWAVQPTLIAIIADTMLKWEESQRKGTTRSQFVLPRHAIVYGIAYDAFGFIIYGFFPRVLHKKPDGTPDDWGFGCAPVDTQFNKVFVKHSWKPRMRACVCLLMIQHHAVMLSAQLRELELPVEFNDCANLWVQRKL